MMGLSRLVLGLLLLVLVSASYATGLLGWLDLQVLINQRELLLSWHDRQPLLSLAAFSLAYLAVTGLSLPGAALLSLAAGAVFGLWTGTLVVSFSSVSGACIAFLCSRHLFRDCVEQRFASHLAPVRKGFDRDGAFYLFALRMVPAVPFFVVNLLVGLTRLRLFTFAWVSMLGMLPATLVYVFAGTRLASVTSLGDVLDPVLWIALTLIGLLPLLARELLTRFRATGTPGCREGT